MQVKAMAVSKAQRQHKIARILSDQTITSQSQVVELLADAGITATQATVSRDLDELGAVKVRVSGGATVYAIPEHPTEQLAPHEHLRRVLGEWLADVTRSGDLVVVRTPPGSAHVVASALDRSGMEDMIGTVAGDDTVLAVAAQGQGEMLAKRLSEAAGLV